MKAWQKIKIWKKNGGWSLPRLIITLIAVIIILPISLAWFFGIGFCNHTFMMPVDIEVERVDFPYDSESAFDAISVRYYDLAVGRGKYQRALGYLFYEPSFDISYSNNYKSCTQREYDRGVGSHQDDITVSNIKEYDYRALKEIGNPYLFKSGEMHINGKGKTEKIVELTYHVPSDSIFIEKEKELTCVESGKYPDYVVEFKDGFWIIREKGEDPCGGTYPCQWREVPEPKVLYTSVPEERTVKYKITVNVPRNPLKGYIHTYCPNLL